LAPVLVFTAEEAWLARFPDDESVHLRTWPDLPELWRDEALATKFSAVRDARAVATAELEVARRNGVIGSSLQARVTLQGDAFGALSPEMWEEVLIASQVAVAPGAEPSAIVEAAPGTKCDRCWRVLPEVGQSHAHPTLCRRCEAVVEGRNG
jgi:isoleucyl-tRNA synthetase